MAELTHNELVRRAGNWLRATVGCAVVMLERSSYTDSRETPDAIGWHNQRCVLVECKTSLADFRADQHKPARQQDMPALGHWRIYMAEPGVIPADQVPSGWSLYEVHERQVRHICGPRWANAVAPPCASDANSEIALLLSTIRRLEISTTVFIREATDDTAHPDQP